MLYSKDTLPRAKYVPISKNYYALRDEWVTMSKLEQHRDICACINKRRKGLIFTGQSACCIYHIPRLNPYEMRPDCISDKVKGSDFIRWHLGMHDPKARMLNGFLVACPIQTIFDLLMYDSAESILVSINHCLFNKLFNLDEFVNELGNRPGMKKIKLLRSLVRFMNEKCESPLETIGWIEIYKAGLVLPQQQVDIFDNHKFVGCVDMYWELRGRKIILELDGKVKLKVGDDLLAEKKREDKLRKAGYEVFRTNWKDVRSGELVNMLTDIGIPKRRNHGSKFPE